MKHLLIIASIVALAVAGPTYRELVGAMPVAPVDIDTDSISIGPAIIEGSPVSIGPAIVDVPISSNTPLVQIILNINTVPADPVVPAPAPSPVPIEADPVQVVDVAPVDIGMPELPTPEVIPEPVLIGDPQLPIAPADVLPEELN